MTDSRSTTEQVGPIRLPRRCFIYPRGTVTRTVRGVDWVTDGAVVVRADALITPPTTQSDTINVTATRVRQILDQARGEGVQLRPRSYLSHVPLQGPTRLRLLQGSGRFVALNDKVGDVWLQHAWASITQDRKPFVEFREMRRGRPVLIGIVMPVHLAGTISALPTEAVPDVA